MKSTVLLFLLVLHICTCQTIPPKCCDPMHMPVNGKCQEVKCRNEAQCAEKFQGYCTKYNKGQSICRGISGVCGCNGERSNFDKYPTGPNCPANQKCYSNGKCGPIDQKCSNPDHVPFNGQCQKVECRNEEQCGQYKDYCSKNKIGIPICRGISEICGCNGERSSVDIASANAPKSCNRNLNGNDKCPTNQICFPDGHCGPHPGCEFFGANCDPQTKKCCDAHCHKRKLSSSYSCVRTGFVGDDCTNGIPCEDSSQCINGKCSLRIDDECYNVDNVCPPRSSCVHVPMDTGKNKMCKRD